MALMQTGSDAAQQRAQREAAGATVDEGRWIYLSAIIHCTQAHLAQSGRAAIPRQRPELSERQRDVLEGLAQGQRQKQIAYNLQISENTVAYHVAQLRRRLECSHSNEIVAAAYLAGLLTPR
ncbi:LuxR family transcriptional regulator [Qipengyuania flava]|uniref:LuxR family transcriptional regulator n=2 Tax=Qipengyuania flava TaxID=192812 RepID=A0A5P6N9A4_9SPHN|nr:LuxR family transcriptional regulator [Qipengyuania flava]